jgi:hypothetical protein
MTAGKGWQIVLRTVIMSLISLLFLHNRWANLLQMRAHGVPIGSWQYFGVGIWVFALVAWIGTGWRDLARVRTQDQENR